MSSSVAHPMWNVPNILSLSRIPLGIVLFACIVYGAWLAGLIVFILAVLTDWLDGWWARRYGPMTSLGRSLDPLTDKVLICGAFIYLIPVPDAGILPWMVTLVVCRELIVTGIRGLVESAGMKFGADWFGKLKTALQCAVLIGILLQQTLHDLTGRTDPWQLGIVVIAITWAMLLATLGSGIQYIVKAVRLLS